VSVAFPIPRAPLPKARACADNEDQATLKIIVLTIRSRYLVQTSTIQVLLAAASIDPPLSFADRRRWAGIARGRETSAILWYSELLKVTFAPFGIGVRWRRRAPTAQRPPPVVVVAVCGCGSRAVLVPSGCGRSASVPRPAQRGREHELRLLVAGRTRLATVFVLSARNVPVQFEGRLSFNPRRLVCDRP